VEKENRANAHLANQAATSGSEYRNRSSKRKMGECPREKSSKNAKKSIKTRKNEKNREKKADFPSIPAEKTVDYNHFTLTG